MTPLTLIIYKFIIVSCLPLKTAPGDPVIHNTLFHKSDYLNQGVLATPGEEVMGSIPAVPARSLLVGFDVDIL